MNIDCMKLLKKYEKTSFSDILTMMALVPQITSKAEMTANFNIRRCVVALICTYIEKNENREIVDRRLEATESRSSYCYDMQMYMPYLREKRRRVWRSLH